MDTQSFSNFHGYLRSNKFKCMSLVVVKTEMRSLYRAKNKVETPCVYHKSLDYVRAQKKRMTEAIPLLKIATNAHLDSYT